MNEISGENLSKLEKRYRTTFFIVLAQIIVVLILVFVSWFGISMVETDLSSRDFSTF